MMQRSNKNRRKSSQPFPIISHKEIHTCILSNSLQKGFHSIRCDDLHHEGDGYSKNKKKCMKKKS